MNVLKIRNYGLTSYYLDQNLSHIEDETGLVIIKDEEGEEEDQIELHYEDINDLELKLSLILTHLTDK